MFSPYLLIVFVSWITLANTTFLSPMYPPPPCGAPPPPCGAPPPPCGAPPPYGAPPPCGASLSDLSLAASLLPGLGCAAPPPPPPSPLFPPPACGCAPPAPPPQCPCAQPSIAISPTLGLISKLKAKLCSKLCGGGCGLAPALNPMALAGGCAPPPKFC